MGNNNLAIPLVSICCLVYNHESYLRECFEGFVMQKTTFPIEVLVHDDASTDKSVEIIKEYADKYPDLFKPIYQKENQYSKGVPVTRVFQFPRAKGKYIAMCEGDDYWTDPYKLQKQVDFLETNEVYALCYTDVDFLYQNTKRIEKAVFRNHFAYRATSFEDHLINKAYLAPCTWVFRRDILDVIQFGEIFVDGSFAFLLDIFKHSSLYFYDEVTAVYRISKGTASHPNTENEEYCYHKGVFEIQKKYILKYNVDTKTSNYVYSGGYLNLLKYAIVLKDADFIQEAECFYDSLGMNMPRLISLCNENILLKDKIKKIQKSKAYRLRKFILFPLKKIKVLLNKLKGRNATNFSNSA